ncbi:MAG: class I SAM-dependent methyltransferase [Oscillospiraceae bacterium]|nr:class I SAM-dependent methyltransferase [Oscillospiraceae bacterium]
MYIKWNNDSVRWFCDASEYTGFNRRLAELILDHIDSRDTLADLGCGAGLIDMELAPRIGHITCVDIDEYAVRSVTALAERCGIGNITAVCADAATIDGQWDTVLALFHGRIETFLSKYFDMARETFIAVVRGNPLRIDQIPEEILHLYRTVEQTSEILDKLGMRYELIRGSLEYGQPFRSREDAELYARAYRKCRDGESMDACLARTLTQTEDPEFPLYMPYEKKFGMYIIKKADNTGFTFDKDLTGGL